MKKGKLAVEYIAIIVLILAVVLVMILFSDKIRVEVVEGVTEFISGVVR
jgi:hypothetical protein